MKYIRTKDENNLIIDMTDMHLLYNLTDKYIDFNRFGRFDIVRQADTIEELCDEFVMFTNGNKRNIRVYKTMHSISLYTKRDKKYKGNMVEKVYSAIWTDKGLIYVAKMNDKGELELL